MEQAREALRGWLSLPGSAPSALLDVAALFPKAASAIRNDLQVLL